MNTDRFKFRIWHDQQGMIYPDGTFIRVSQDKIMKLDPSIEEPRYFIMPLQDYDLMQCTGLKDIEGNLVYEGDILRWVSYEGFETGDIKGIYVVTWNDEGFYELHDPFSDEYWPINDTEFDNIIGNIYEHIHLLPDYERVQE